MKYLLKQLAFLLATVLVSPLLMLFWIQARILGRDRALQSSSQSLSLVPGLTGQLLRRAFYGHALATCHPSVCIEFGVLFSRADARLGRNVYIGPMSQIGLADIGDDVLIAPGVHIPSGPSTHGIADLTVPIREQAGRVQTVRIGAGSWVGSAAIVMANVGAKSIIMAGSVVLEPVPDRVIAGGVPARVLHARQGISS